LKFFLHLFIFTQVVLAAPRQLYTLNDLEALESNNNFREFFAHALDIRPSKRNKTWTQMCMSMAESFMRELRKKSINDEDRKLLLKVFDYPGLKNDEFFIERRDQFLAHIIEDYSKNHSHKETVQLAKDIYNNFQGKAILGIHISKKLYPIVKSQEEHLVYLDFFENITAPMLKSKFSEFYCGKAPINELIVDLIFYNNLGPKEMHQDCMNKVLPELEKKLYGQNNKERQSSYEFLARYGHLKQKDRAHYHILNLFYGQKYEKNEWDPIIKALKVIGDNYEYRSKIMQIIKEHDPYPDNLFKLYSEKQLIGLTRLISRYFPEYLDRYTNQCLNYLSGKKSFKNGNPTPNCHRYMKISEQSKSSPEQVLKQYDEIVNGWRRK